jgi:hypothetical protein
MATCPNGHDSDSTDFCDVCGMRIGAPPVSPDPSSAPSGSAASGEAPAAAAPDAAGDAPPAEPCPQCGTNRTGQFCEGCGFDFSAGAASAVAPSAGSVPPPDGEPEWTAVVTADRDYFESVIAADGPDAAAIEFPTYCPERRFQLTGREMRIGRHSASRGLHPEIDLTGPPTDPGISRLHAVLTADADGGWAVLDPGSANGTQVNGRDIPVGVTVPLHDGDRICIGGWTVVTIQAGQGGA